MINFVNNPFEILLDIMKEHYPGAECDIFIGDTLTDGIETFGATHYPLNEKERVTVELHYSLPIEGATDVLAHELAHVIVGGEGGHGIEWEKIFHNLHVLFVNKMREINKQIEEG